MFIGGILERTVDRARAQHAADAAALAGAAEGVDAARAVAAANGATIVDLVDGDGRFEVTVRYDGVVAAAHAELVVVPLGSGPRS